MLRVYSVVQHGRDRDVDGSPLARLDAQQFDVVDLLAEAHEEVCYLS